MISNETTKTVIVIDCEVYSRVVGYYRPVQNWNEGKKHEFFTRKNVIISTPSQAPAEKPE